MRRPAREGERWPTLPERRLTAIERARLAAEVIAAWVHARRAMRTLPIEASVKRLRAPAAGPARSAPAARAGEAHRLARAVLLTLRPLPGDTRCLARSLALTRVLARRAIPSTLVIGARTDPGFLAHAWVEHAGQALLDPGEGQFQRLVEL
jgi:hypothetical protein